jgi:hypothetical protein
MAKTPAVVDFGDEFAVDDSPVPTVLVRNVFGEDFLVLKDVNLFAAMAMADDEPKLSDMHRMMCNLIADEDRVRFRSHIARQKNLKAEQIGALFNRLLEVAGDEHPPRSSSGSARTTRTKAVGGRSGAGSSRSSGAKALNA